ncbi:hypothetical protein KI387_036597, partial [Taxus chinensis]
MEKSAKSYTLIDSKDSVTTKISTTAMESRILALDITSVESSRKIYADNSEHLVSDFYCPLSK